MIKLSITAKKTSVTVQDPRAVTQNNGEQAVISVLSGQSTTVEMQWQQLERIAGQLKSLADLDFCTFAIDASDGPAFAAQPDDVNNPSIDLVTDAIAAAGSTGVSITGNNLLAGQTQATASVVGAAGAGSVMFTTIMPGYAGNDADVQVINTGSGGLSVTATTVNSRNVITIDLGGATVTCAALVTAANTALGDDYIAVAVGVSTTVVVIQNLTPFTAGAGSGMAITLAGAACTLKSVDQTSAPIITITVDTPAIGTADDVAKLRIRSDSKEDLASVILA